MGKLLGVASRRGVIRAGLALLAAAGVARQAAAHERTKWQRLAQEAEKLAQDVVQYQTTPKDGAKCSTCVNFVAPNACKIVTGNISPEGWCVAYAPMNG